MAVVDDRSPIVVHFDRYDLKVEFAFRWIVHDEFFINGDSISVKQYGRLALACAVTQRVVIEMDDLQKEYKRGGRMRALFKMTPD